VVLIDGKSPAGDGITRPVAWVRDFGEGRVFYTILGHGPQTHADPRFQQMIARALICGQ
jgi:type 1 glutamine amidotransferase